MGRVSKRANSKTQKAQRDAKKAYREQIKKRKDKTKGA